MAYTFLPPYPFAPTQHLQTQPATPVQIIPFHPFQSERTRNLHRANALAHAACHSHQKKKNRTQGPPPQNSPSEDDDPVTNTTLTISPRSSSSLPQPSPPSKLKGSSDPFNSMPLQFHATNNLPPNPLEHLLLERPYTRRTHNSAKQALGRTHRSLQTSVIGVGIVACCGAAFCS